MFRVENDLVVTKKINEQVALVKQREEELQRQRHKQIAVLGENAVAQGFSRNHLVPKVQSTIARSLEIANKLGFEEIARPQNASDWETLFLIKSNPVLINNGRIALQLVFSGYKPQVETEDFWRLLEDQGIESAVAEFCGVYTPSVFASDPLNGGSRILSTHLAPTSFTPRDEALYKRFSSFASPFMGIAPLRSPREQKGTRTNVGRYPDASHLSDEGLIWAAGLDARFGSYLDVLDPELAD